MDINCLSGRLFSPSLSVQRSFCEERQDIVGGYEHGTWAQAQRVKYLSQVHEAGEWTGQDVNFSLLVFNSYPFPQAELPKLSWASPGDAC